MAWVEGFQPKKVVATLEQGTGGTLTDLGDCFVPLAKDGEIFIKMITVGEGMAKYKLAPTPMTLT